MRSPGSLIINPPLSYLYPREGPPGEGRARRDLHPRPGQDPDRTVAHHPGRSRRVLHRRTGCPPGADAHPGTDLRQRGQSAPMPVGLPDHGQPDLRARVMIALLILAWTGYLTWEHALAATVTGIIGALWLYRFLITFNYPQ